MESAPRPFVRLLTVAVVLLCLAVVGQVLLWRLDNPTGFDGDESDHALWAATVYLDLAQGNLPAFLRHLYAQNRFPPLYSLLQLPFVAALGTTPLAHRVTATFWLLVLCAVTYAAVAAGRRDAWAGACLAVLLVAGCPRLLALATMVYFESAGFALMLLTYALYLQARRHAAASPASRGVAPPRRDPALWAAAACYFLLWFLKWQYGLLVGAVLIAHLLIVHRFRWPGLRHDRAGWTVLLPAWAAVALWLANPYQLREFLLYLTGVPKPEGLYARLVEGYLLQGRFLLTDWSATLPAALLTAGGLVYGLCRLRRPDTLLYTLAAGAALIVSANVRGGAESRIMMWVLPPLWVLVGLGVNEGLGALRAPRGCLLRPRCAWGGAPAPATPTPGSVAGFGASALLLGLLLLTAGNVTAGLRQARAEIQSPGVPHFWAAVDYVATHVSPLRRLVLVDCWGRGLPPNAVKWGYLARWGPEGLSFDDLHVWEWPMLPSAPHPLRWRWPWRARLPGPPPGPPPSEAQRLADSNITALAVWSPASETPAPWKTRLLQEAAESLGFRPVGEFAAPAGELRLVVYLSFPEER